MRAATFTGLTPITPLTLLPGGRPLWIVALVVVAHGVLLGALAAPGHEKPAAAAVAPVILARTLALPAATPATPVPAAAPVAAPAVSQPPSHAPSHAPAVTRPRAITRPLAKPSPPSEPVFKPVVASAPAIAPSSPPQRLAPPEEPLTEARFDADYLRNPAPSYPYLARRRRQQGTVLLDVVIDPAGKPTHVELHASSGFSSLDEAALAAVRQWSFVPARRGRQAVPSRVRVPLEFRIP